MNLLSRLTALIYFGLTGLTVLAADNPAYDAHLSDLRKRIPDEFTLIEEAPFVVLSDQADQPLDLSVRTVRWTVQHLKKDFFAKDPTETIDIWLFKNKTSYKKYTWELFQEEPTSPFGYYSSKNHALLVSIAQGGGTLVHEIVHPYMRANFPACPTWFDEGLASLFEQATEQKGHIVGLINWRLQGLQQVIREGKTLSFQKLTALSPAEFYGPENNPNYSLYYGQARYLCYYLQEQGLLIKYYQAFSANAAADPTGYITLQHILGVEDMASFQKKWESFVMALPLPK
jgi:hypothetical protein